MKEGTKAIDITHKAPGNIKRAVTLNARLMISIGIVFALSGIMVIVFLNWRMKTYALDEAEQKAEIMLNQNLAIHTYFTHQLKPALFKMERSVGSDRPEIYFDPVWMSSTYAVREIEKYFRILADETYSYKECAINARNPENEADDFEKAFIRELNRSPELKLKAKVRVIEGKPQFQVLRRGEVMEGSCLRCHSKPVVAPEGLISRYGPDRSFNRSVGEVVSAISIKVPLSVAYAKINRLLWRLSALFAFILICLFGVVFSLNNRWVFGPLKAIRAKAFEISENPEKLGEQIDSFAGKELSELSQTFNKMSSQLRGERDQLEVRVEERTDDLKRANEELEHVIDQRDKTILSLEKAIKEVKRLQGILPICAKCKKIRDDTGYWNKVESYIQEHSEAEFSHGICPECMKELYPELVKEEKP